MENGAERPENEPKPQAEQQPQAEPEPEPAPGPDPEPAPAAEPKPAEPTPAAPAGGGILRRTRRIHPKLLVTSGATFVLAIALTVLNQFSTTSWFGDVVDLVSNAEWLAKGLVGFFGAASVGTGLYALSDTARIQQLEEQMAALRAAAAPAAPPAERAPRPLRRRYAFLLLPAPLLYGSATLTVILIWAVYITMLPPPWDDSNHRAQPSGRPAASAGPDHGRTSPAPTPAGAGSPTASSRPGPGASASGDPSSGDPSSSDPGGDPNGGGPATTGWGFAYVDRATPNEAPLGADTPLGAQTQWTTARNDPTNPVASVLHTSTGHYTVRLPGIGGDRGIAHTTAYRTDYRGHTCLVAGYRRDGRDELVDVRCVDLAGSPVDWWFMVYFGSPSAGDAPLATIRYDAAGGAADQLPVRNSGSYNSDGAGNRVWHEGTGRYRVLLPGAPFATGTGQVQLTAFGRTSAANCHAAALSPGGDGLTITVRCFAVGTSATARPVDTPWLLSYVDGSGLSHDDGVPAAYATVTGGANPVLDGRRSYASNDEPAAVARLGTGHYRLTYLRLGKHGDSVQVSATGSTGAYCHPGNVSSNVTAPKVTIDVYCHSLAGLPADAGFTAAYLRVP